MILLSCEDEKNGDKRCDPAEFLLVKLYPKGLRQGKHTKKRNAQVMTNQKITKEELVNSKKSLLVSMGFALVILSFSDIVHAQALNHDNTSNATPPGQSTSTPITGSGFDAGSGSRRGTDFQAQSIGGGNISVPQDIVNLISASSSPTSIGTNGGNFDNSGIVGTSTDVATGENSSTGSSDSTLTRRSVTTGTDTGESTTGEGIAEGPNSNESSGSEISPDQIVICLSDPCGSVDNPSANTISVNELAKLIENDLDQALNNLAAAERGELNLDDNAISQDLTDNPRRIVRRQSSSDVDRFTRRDSMVNEDCGCVPGERKIVREPSNFDNSTIVQNNTETLVKARQIVETKLEDANILIEQINQLNPDNSIW